MEISLHCFLQPTCLSECRASHQHQQPKRKNGDRHPVCRRDLTPLADKVVSAVSATVLVTQSLISRSQNRLQLFQTE
jgi:hypothetical protein